jgi:hypothetical protein
MEPGKYEVSVTDSRGIVIGDHNLIVQHFTAGLSGLATDYSVRFANFLTEYVGTAENPVPFGGREPEMAFLDGWLANPSAPPYVLLTAPAGRGKTALLVQWLRRLEGRSDIATAFVPVSIRFRTNQASVVFASLAVRLANLCERPLPSSVAVSAEEWRGIVSGYLAGSPVQGKTLLVIVDSVDEAADWTAGPDLFPLDPPPGLRVVVSARFLAGDTNPQAWRERLGWTRDGLSQTMTLESLNRTSVAGLISDTIWTGNDSPAKATLIGELWRLTGGDPLLLRLYIEYLRSPTGGTSKLSDFDLPSLPPGLQGYFQRWWDEQRRLWGAEAPLRERPVQMLLNLLAVAFGPLTQQDLQQLEPTLSSWSLEEALQPLKRFVLGDGMVQGFAFSHPRLAGYFYDRISLVDRQMTESRFVTWGADTIQALGGSSPSRTVPSYLSQYYTAHLSRTERQDELFSLIHNRSWFEAQLAVEPSGVAFLQDVRQAMVLAKASNAAALSNGRLLPLLNQEVRCALASASLRSLSHNFPASLLAVLVRTKHWTPRQALVAARQNPSVPDRVAAVGALAPLVSENSDFLVTLRETLEAVRQLDNTTAFPHRRMALTDLVPHLSPNLLNEALAIAKTTFDADESVLALGPMVRYLPQEQQPEVAELALVLARALSEEHDEGWGNTRNARALAFIELAKCLPDPYRAGAATEALASARATASSDWRSKLLAWLAPHLPEPAKGEALIEALAAAKIEDWEQGPAQALEVLAPLLPDSLVPDAFEAAVELRWLPGLAPLLTALAPRLPQQILQEGVKRALALDATFDRERALEALAVRLGELGDLDSARRTAQHITNGYLKEHTAALLTQYIARFATPDEAVRVLRAVEGPFRWLHALPGLIDLLPDSLLKEVIDEAIVAAQSESLQKSFALDSTGDAVATLAVRLTQKRYGKQALTLVRALPVQDSRGHRARVHALSELLVAGNSDFGDDVVREAVAAAQAIQDYGEEAAVLFSVMSQLPLGEQSDLQTQALRVVRLVPDEIRRGKVLTKVLGELSGPSLDGVLSEAIRVVRDRSSADDSWLGILTEMGPFLTSSAIETLLSRDSVTDADQELEAQVIRAIGALLPEPMIERVVVRAAAYKDSSARIAALSPLTRRMPRSSRDRYVRRLLKDVAALPISERSGFSPRGEALAQLVPHVVLPCLEPTVRLARSLIRKEPDAYMRVLEELAPRVAELGDGAYALRMVEAVEPEWRRGPALAKVIRHLPDPLLHEALTLLKGMNRQHCRGALVQLVLRLPPADTNELLLDALIVIVTPDAWTEAGDYSKSLSFLRDRLTPPLLRSALNRIRSGFADRPDVRATALAILADLCRADSEALWAEAVDTAKSIDDTDDRAAALATIALNAPDALIPRILSAVVSVPGGKYLYINSRSDALAKIVSRLELSPLPVMYRLWQHALEASASRTRSELFTDLAAMAPVLNKLGDTVAVRGTTQAILDTVQCWQ